MAMALNWNDGERAVQAHAAKWGFCGAQHFLFPRYYGVVKAVVG